LRSEISIRAVRRYSCPQIINLLIPLPDAAAEGERAKEAPRAGRYFDASAVLISASWGLRFGDKSRRFSMWYGVNCWAVRIRRRDGEEGGKRRAVGGTGSVGRVAWIWRLAGFFYSTSMVVPWFALRRFDPVPLNHSPLSTPSLALTSSDPDAESKGSMTYL
jgi:hypothetical protein